MPLHENPIPTPVSPVRGADTDKGMYHFRVSEEE